MTLFFIFLFFIIPGPADLTVNCATPQGAISTRSERDSLMEHLLTLFGNK